MQTQFNKRSYYFTSVWNGCCIHLAAAVSLPSLAVSAIPSLPSPGAVGALPDATVSLSTPTERSTGREAQPAVSIIHSFDKVWTVLGSGVGWDGGGSGSGECSKTFHYNHPIRKTETRVARNFGAANWLIFLSWNYKLQWFSSPFRIAIVEMLPRPNNGLFPLGVCSNWEKRM